MLLSDLELAQHTLMEMPLTVTINNDNLKKEVSDFYSAVQKLSNYEGDNNVWFVGSAQHIEYSYLKIDNDIKGFVKLLQVHYPVIDDNDTKAIYANEIKLVHKLDSNFKDFSAIIFKEILKSTKLPLISDNGHSDTMIALYKKWMESPSIIGAKEVKIYSVTNSKLYPLTNHNVWGGTETYKNLRIVLLKDNLVLENFIPWGNIEDYQ